MPFEQLINQFSFLVIAVGGIALLAVLLLRDGVRKNDLIALGALLIGFGLAFALLQPGPDSFTSSDIITSQIGAGRPVLLELLSPY